MNNFGCDLPVKLVNSALFDSRGFFGGKWRFAASNKTFAVTEPSSGQILAYCSDFAQQDFIEAIELADHGFRHYHSHTTAKQRGSLLRKWNDLILENLNDRMSQTKNRGVLKILINNSCNHPLFGERENSGRGER